MELIPIIYSVLLIVVALTIITLTISYIASRLRHSRATETQKNSTSSAPPAIPVKIISAKKSSPEKSNSSPASSRNELKPLPKKHEQALPPKLNEKKEKPHRTDPKKETRNKRTTRRNYTSDNSKSAEEKPKILNDRISVLKNLTPHNERKETGPKTKPAPVSKNKKALGDDILGNYMEDDHNDMFTLKVKKDSDNQEQ